MAESIKQIGFNREPDKAVGPTKLVGATGTSIWAGYYDEEYLSDLRGPHGYDIYNEMRRSDGQVRMVLAAIKNPIRSAKFNFESADPKNAKANEAAEFCEWNWKYNPNFSFPKWLSEVLTFLDFGFSMHEYAFGVYDHRDFGLVHCISQMSFRKQKTIERFIVTPERGLIGVDQIAMGDTVAGTSTCVRIPIESLCLFTNEAEGDNYEGVSMLRAAYGPWFRKQHLLKMDMIGSEKASVGTPIGKHPVAATKEQIDAFESMVSSMAINEHNYMVAPEGFSLDIIKNTYDAEKLMSSLAYQDAQMSRSVLMQWLELGQNGNGGSFALGADSSDFSLAALQFTGEMITSKMQAINERLVQANFGDLDLAPIVKCVGINEKAGTELATLIKTYVDGRVIRADDALEAHVRKVHGLPEAEKKRADDKEPPAPPPVGVPPGTELPKVEKDPEADPEPKPAAKFNDRPVWTPFRALTKYEQGLNFAEMFDAGNESRDRLTTSMRRNLIATADYLRRQLKKRLGAGPKDKIRAIEKIDVNTEDYEASLLKEMAALAGQGSEQASAMLAAKVQGHKFADPYKRQLAFLPPHVKKALEAQAKTQAAAHAQKMKDILSHTVAQQVADGLPDSEILSNVEDRLNEFVDSPQVAGAANTISTQALNRGRDATLFNQDNLKQIQAFQFSAILDDATTDICLSLDGKIFKTDDPQADRLTPPLHHGCRSILIPITINEEKPEFTGLDMDPTNQSLIDEYERRGKPAPDLAKIKKSRNL